MDEIELVERAAGGDREAFGALVERYRNAVYGIAWSYARDFETARDLAQEVFVQAYLKREQLRDPAAFSAWLRALAINRCRMWARRRAAAAVSLEQVETDHEAASNGLCLHDPTPDPHFLLEREQLHEAVRAAVLELPDRQRMVVSLFYLGGLSYQQIAEFLGESVGAVESRLHRARQCLRERMPDMVDESLKSHELSKDFTTEVLRQLVFVSMPNYHPGVPQPLSISFRHEEQHLKPILLSEIQTVTIAWKLMGRDTLRPMTHHLVPRILRAFDISLTRVVLAKETGRPLQASVSFERYGIEQTVATEPSEAITVAMQVGADIYYQGRLPRRAPIAQERPAEPPPEMSPERKAAIAAIDAAMARMNARRKQRWPRINWQTTPEIRVCQLAAVEGSGLLKLTNEDWILEIYIGPQESHFMALALRKEGRAIAFPRIAKRPSLEPAYRLIGEMLSALEINLEWVGIDSHHEGTYFALLALRQGDSLHYIDARPSDAVNLALLLGRPIRAVHELFDEVGVCKGALANGDFSRAERKSGEIVERALDKAAEYIESSGERTRVTIAEAENGGVQCRVLARRGQVIHEESGGSWDDCRRYHSDFRLFSRPNPCSLSRLFCFRPKFTKKADLPYRAELVLSPNEKATTEK